MNQVNMPPQDPTDHGNISTTNRFPSIWPFFLPSLEYIRNKSFVDNHPSSTPNSHFLGFAILSLLWCKHSNIALPSSQHVMGGRGTILPPLKKGKRSSDVLTAF